MSAQTSNPKPTGIEALTSRSAGFASSAAFAKKGKGLDLIKARGCLGVKLLFYRRQRIRP